MLSGYLERVKRNHRYLAVLVVLSLVVTFIVPLGLIENADSKTGLLICGVVEHTYNTECNYGATCTITPYVHTEDCYRKASLLAGASAVTEPMLQINAAGAAAIDSTTFTTKNVSADTTVTLSVKDTASGETKEKQIKVKPFAITSANGYSMVPGTAQTLNITAGDGMTYTVSSDNASVVAITESEGVCDRRRR